MRLRDVHPDDFARAGSLLADVSDQVADTISQSRMCAEVRWVGRPNQRYQEQLRELNRDLSRVRSSFEDAGDALLVYAHALGVVRDLALRADLLDAEADDLVGARLRADWRDHQDGTAVTSLALTPHEQALRDRARLLHAEAEEIARAASRRVVARLRDLTDHAMRVSGWKSLNRGIARASGSFAQVALGDVSLAADAFRAVPGVGDEVSRTAAREQLWAAGAALVQPWLPVEQMVTQLGDGDYSRTVGEAAGVLVLKGHGGRKEELFGAHDALPFEVLGALKGNAGLERSTLHEAQQAFFRELQRFSTIAAPTVDELLENGVDLVQQEALGGHTLLKHVGRDLDFLGRRQVAESRPGRSLRPMSSFLSQEEAEFAVNRTLTWRNNEASLREWARGDDADPLRLHASISGVGVVRGPGGAQLASGLVVVEFVKDVGGRVIVNSAFVDAGH